MMFQTLNYAYGQPEASGVLKGHPDDFFVQESLGYPLSGTGEHLYVLIEKVQRSTEDVIHRMMRTFELPQRSISYAGLKDKQAKTQQWFSLHLPGQLDPDLSLLNDEHVTVLEAKRHHKKLKIGALKENYFVVRIRDFNYQAQEMQRRIALVNAHGVPNYFGPQRFGHQEGNLLRAKRFLLENRAIKNRQLRSICLSAARSLLFNQIVSLRVAKDCWASPVAGDLMMLSGTNSVFQVEVIDDALIKRVEEKDIAPAATLWGEGVERLSETAYELQQHALVPFQDWCVALEKKRLQRAYRSMVLFPKNLTLNKDTFSFKLPKGSYATIVLRELMQICSF